MSEHLSTGIVERFERQGLAPGDRLLIYDHVKLCERCRQLIVDSRGEGIVLRALSDQLVPDGSAEPYHLDFDLIEGYVDETLSRVDRDTAEMHLEVCPTCSAEVKDLRASLATMRASSLLRRSPEDSSIKDGVHAFSRLPGLFYSLRLPAIVGLLLLMIATGLVMWQMRSANREARQNPSEPGVKGVQEQSSPAPMQVTPSPSIAGTVPNVPLTVKRPQQTPLQSSSTENAGDQGLVLKDGVNVVALDHRGKLTGLEDLPDEVRQEVRDVLLVGVIKKPEILTDLAGPETVVRGSSDGDKAIKLLYPGSTVVAEDRPLFRWSPLKDASGYKVHVGDATFHEVAKSDELPPTSTEWRPATTLKRGEVYTWVVKVVREGVETSPSSPQPEMKFQVLNADRLAYLQRLKTRSPSHLALGVFYAREGMIADAEDEFQILVRQNPRHSIAKKLLLQVQSWQSQGRKQDLRRAKSKAGESLPQLSP